MRRSLRRWLLQRRTSTLQPLYQRTTWYDFAGRMHRAIALDIALLLGEITLAEVRAQQMTRLLPVVEPDAPTCVTEIRVDANATLPIEIPI